MSDWISKQIDKHSGANKGNITEQVNQWAVYIINELLAQYLPPNSWFFWTTVKMKSKVNEWLLFFFPPYFLPFFLFLFFFLSRRRSHCHHSLSLFLINFLPTSLSFFLFFYDKGPIFHHHISFFLSFLSLFKFLCRWTYRRTEGHDLLNRCKVASKN